MYLYLNKLHYFRTWHLLLHKAIQIFAVLRSGNYIITIVGVSGGYGVCTNNSGLGVAVR